MYLTVNTTFEEASVARTRRSAANFNQLVLGRCKFSHVVIQSRVLPTRTLEITEKIHGCSEDGEKEEGRIMLTFIESS